MAREDEEEKLMTAFIPDNVEDGVDLIVVTVPFKDLAIGAIIVAPIILIIAYSFFKKGKIVDAGLVALIGVIIAGFIAMGINNEPLTDVFLHMLKYKKERRRCFYNPRVKAEIVPMSSLNVDAIRKRPIDFMSEKYQKYSENKTYENFRETNLDSYEFEDDIEYKKSLEEQRKEKLKNGKQKKKATSKKRRKKH